MTRHIFILVLVLLSGQAFADTSAGSKKAPALVVCYTTGSVNSRQASRATKAMLEVLERLAGIPAGTYQSRFTSHTKECLDLLKDKTTRFISPTLGFFLRHREEYHLTPMVLPSIHGKSTDRWYVVVRKGSYKQLSDMKGKVVGGPLADDPEFLKRIVFQGKIDPANFFVLKRSFRVLRALRRLVKGKLDAVILNQQQYKALPALPFSKDLAVVFTSDPMPVPSILAVGPRANPKELKRFANALSGFCSDPKGKSFCALFGIDSFVPANNSVYRKVETLWQKGSKKGTGAH